MKGDKQRRTLLGPGGRDGRKGGQQADGQSRESHCRIAWWMSRRGGNESCNLNRKEKKKTSVRNRDVKRKRENGVAVQRVQGWRIQRCRVRNSNFFYWVLLRQGFFGLEACWGHDVTTEYPQSVARTIQLAVCGSRSLGKLCAAGATGVPVAATVSLTVGLRFPKRR